MKIIITGATGHVGNALVEKLSSLEHKLILVGRDVERLNKFFPNIEACTYKEIKKIGKGASVLVHLATANNNTKAAKEIFIDANVRLFDYILKTSLKLKIKKVITLNSLHIFSDKQNNYVYSKKKAHEILQKFDSFQKITIFCPAIYSKTFKGNLKILNIFPNKLKKVLFYFLSAFRPVVNIKTVISHIIFNINKKSSLSKNIYLADNKEKNLVYIFFRKSVDIIFAIFVIVFLWWLLLFIYFAIKIDTDGPVIFKQKRIGKNEKLFLLYKFRTMQVGTRNTATHEISQQSLTGIGYWLRKVKLDELPQVLNILRNDLSLIGPRPSLPTQKKLIKERQILQIYSIKPGITGYSQINNIDMSDPKKLAEYDNIYLAMRSVFFDIRILIKTLLGAGQGDKVMSSYK